MSKQWTTPPDVETGAQSPRAVALAALVLALGGTAEEADRAQKILAKEHLPHRPGGAIRQVQSALDHVRSQESA